VSGIDQPLLIANVNYHIGHEISIRAAEEQGFFREEGLSSYVYQAGGVIPGPYERDGLPLALEERGIDIATAVNVDTVISQRSQGADLYAIGAWRHMPRIRLYASPRIQTLADLRGARVGEREAGGITAVFMQYWLAKVGVDAEREIEWVHDPVFAYRRDSAHMEKLLSGEVDAAQSAPPYSEQLLERGFHLLLDSFQIYPGGRPGKVIAASRRTVEDRGDEVRAFLRGATRGFWFVRAGGAFPYLQDLEARLRQASHNEQERGLHMVTHPEKVEEWVMPLTGSFTREAVERVIDEMVTLGQLKESIPASGVFLDGPISDAWNELATRPELAETRDKALALVKKYGY
jgi:hypothetical protein